MNKETIHFGAPILYTKDPLCRGRHEATVDADAVTKNIESREKRDLDSERTWLSWATQRGDMSAVNTLRAQRRSKHCHTDRYTSLDFAVEALTPTCTAPLLANGADPLEYNSAADLIDGTIAASAAVGKDGDEV